MDGLRIVSSASLRLTGDIAAFTAEVVDSADELNADSCSSEAYASLPSAAGFGYSAFIRRFYDDDVARTQCPAYYFTIGDSWKRVALTSGVVIVSPTREEVRRHRAAYIAADDPSSFDKTIIMELLGSQGVRPTLILHFEAATAYFRWHRLLRFALGTVLLSEACQGSSGPRSSDSSSGEVDAALLDAALARCVSAGLVGDDHPLMQRARALRAFKARLSALAASLSAASDATTDPTAAVLREVKAVLRRLLDRRADPVWSTDPAAVAVMRLGARALPPADLQDLLASTSTPSTSSPASSSSPLSSSPSVAVVGQGAEVVSASPAERSVADPFSSPQVAASVCGGGGRAQTHRHACAPTSSPLAHGAKVRLGPLVEAVAESPTAGVARGGAKGGGGSGGVPRTPLADITPRAVGSPAGPEAGRARLTPPARAGRYFPGTFLAPPRPPASHAPDAVGGSGGSGDSGGAGSAGACLWDDVDALLSPQPPSPSPAAAAATACALSRALSVVAAARAAEQRGGNGGDCDSCSGSDGDGGDKENGGARRSYVSSSSSSASGSAPSSGSSTPLGWGWESVGSDDDEPKIAPGDSGEDSDGSGSLALSMSTSTSTSVDTAPFRSPTKRAPARTGSTGGSAGRRGGRRRAVAFRPPLSSPGPPPAAHPPPRTHLHPPAPAPRGVLKFAPPLPAASATPFARGPQAPLPGWASPASPPGGPGAAGGGGGEEGLDALDVGAGLATTAAGGGEGDGPGRALFTAASPAAPAPWQGPQQQWRRGGGGDFCHASPWASPSLTPSPERGDDFRHDPEDVAEDFLACDELAAPPGRPAHAWRHNLPSPVGLGRHAPARPPPASLGGAAVAALESLWRGLATAPRPPAPIQTQAQTQAHREVEGEGGPGPGPGSPPLRVDNFFDFASPTSSDEGEGEGDEDGDEGDGDGDDDSDDSGPEGSEDNSDGDGDGADSDGIEDVAGAWLLGWRAGAVAVSPGALVRARRTALNTRRNAAVAATFAVVGALRPSDAAQGRRAGALAALAAWCRQEAAERRGEADEGGEAGPWQGADEGCEGQGSPAPSPQRPEAAWVLEDHEIDDEEEEDDEGAGAVAGGGGAGGEGRTSPLFMLLPRLPATDIDPDAAPSAPGAPAAVLPCPVAEAGRGGGAAAGGGQPSLLRVLLAAALLPALAVAVTLSSLSARTPPLHLHLPAPFARHSHDHRAAPPPRPLSEAPQAPLPLPRQPFCPAPSHLLYMNGDDDGRGPSSRGAAPLRFKIVVTRRRSPHAPLWTSEEDLDDDEEEGEEATAGAVIAAASGDRGGSEGEGEGAEPEWRYHLLFSPE